MHKAAELGYQLAARDYERVRPSYPLRSLGMLTDALDLGPGKTVADLGAGTGKFTRLLALTGARVIAVEPVAAMRERLAEVLPQITVTAGLAEATGLPEHSVDAVIAAGERVQRLRAALDGLPSEQLTLLKLTFFAGRSHNEIATLLGVPVGTVKSRLRLGL